MATKGSSVPSPEHGPCRKTKARKLMVVLYFIKQQGLFVLYANFIGSILMLEDDLQWSVVRKLDSAIQLIAIFSIV